MVNRLPSSSQLQMKMTIPLLVVLLQLIHGSIAQQTYVNNKQLECEKNYTNTQGYVCNGASSSCVSYLTFRSNPTYNSPATIGYLLNAEPAEIGRINNISDVSTIPSDTILVVPVNCSCFSYNSTQSYYQHNTSYVLKTGSETYFSVANNTYEGLTTCQSMIAQNPYNYRRLAVGMKITIPLRCACPTSNQTKSGVKYLLTYLVTWGDTVELIGEKFGGVDPQSISDANELSSDGLIFPFTPIIVPLKSEPTKIDIAVSPPPPPQSPPELPSVPVGSGSSSSNKWVFVGAGVGAAVLLLVAFSVYCFLRRRRNRHGEPAPTQSPNAHELAESSIYNAIPSDGKSWSVSSEGVRYAIGSLTVYKFEELQNATSFFSESNRVKGSVYRGSFKGDGAAIKVMKGDVSNEISILKQINHFNIIRLSGFCLHDGNTYLVYEYAENGSLSDWLHSNPKTTSSLTCLGWKQRVQIAYDIADGLNYLHNYTNPPYIHKNLKSTNILLDSQFRAKIANFGLARSLRQNQDVQMTRHVVGTHGYMAPEYIENGLITPKLDVYAFGVVVLELLSGREAARRREKNIREDGEKEEELLVTSVREVLGGENVREKLRGLIDPCLGMEYPLDLAYPLAELAKSCVAHDMNSRPTMAEVFTTLSKILSSSMDWDPSFELNHSRSLSNGR